MAVATAGKTKAKFQVSIVTRVMAVTNRVCTTSRVSIVHVLMSVVVIILICVLRLSCSIKVVSRIARVRSRRFGSSILVVKASLAPRVAVRATIASVQS